MRNKCLRFTRSFFATVLAALSLLAVASSTQAARARPTCGHHLCRRARGFRRGIYAYHPDTNTWEDPLPLPAEVVKSIRYGNYDFHDPVLNAFFCYFASDSDDDGTMWVYRHKKTNK